MVEGIVFEVKIDYVIVMTSSGEFKKLKKKGKVKDGDIYRGTTYSNPIKHYAAAALILFILTGFTGYNAYAHQIVGYIDIMGDKSIRLYVNRLGNVQKSEGFYNQKSIKNLSIYDAVKHLTSLSEMENISFKEVKFKEIKASKFNALEIEKSAKKALTEKNATTSKENKKSEGSIHPKDNKNIPADNINPFNKNNVNNSSNGGNLQIHNPPSPSVEKSNKALNDVIKNNSKNIKWNNHPSNTPQNSEKDSKIIKDKNHRNKSNK